MSKAQIEKFARVEGALACPLCGAGVRLDGTALRCGGGHAFSVAAKGYANFVPNQRPLKGYDRAFFEARARFFGRGAYRHVLDGLLDVLAALDPAPRAVLDAGCGEGSYARAVAAAPGLGGPTVFALDLAKDALQVASRGGSDVLWMAADVARIPLRGASVDCVLDVFTPANYAEFDRVLTPGGIVCKVVPSGAHLHELRHAARGIVRSEDYANDRVADVLRRALQRGRPRSTSLHRRTRRGRAGRPACDDAAAVRCRPRRRRPHRAARGDRRGRRSWWAAAAERAVGGRPRPAPRGAHRVGPAARPLAG